VSAVDLARSVADPQEVSAQVVVRVLHELGQRRLVVEDQPLVRREQVDATKRLAVGVDRLVKVCVDIT
jgi:predicted ATP-dependent serine protease